MYVIFDVVRIQPKICEMILHLKFIIFYLINYIDAVASNVDVVVVDNVVVDGGVRPNEFSLEKLRKVYEDAESDGRNHVGTNPGHKGYI